MDNKILQKRLKIIRKIFILTTNPIYIIKIWKILMIQVFTIKPPIKILRQTTKIKTTRFLKIFILLHLKT